MASVTTGRCETIHRWNPIIFIGITKLEGEKVLRQFFDKMSIAIVRISETYGPRTSR